MGADDRGGTAAAAGSTRPGPGRRWRFWAAACTYVVLLAGPNVPTPLYAGYEREFGFSPLTVTLVFAVYVAALIPSLLAAGPLSDAVGRRRVLLPAVALAVAGSVVFALAAGTAWLFAARIIQGAALGTASGAVTAALAELEPDGNRRRAAMVAAVAAALGVGAGPLLGGLLAQYGPVPHVLPYLTEIALLVPAGIAVAVMPEPGTRSRWRPRRPQVPAAIRAPFLSSGATSFLAWAVTALFLTLIPSYVASLTKSGNLAAGGGVVALMLGCSALTQRAAYGRRAAPLQTGGLGLLTISLVLLIAAGTVHSLGLLLGATVLAGAGQGLGFLGAMTQVSQAAPAGRHADVLSSFYVVTYLGTGLPVIGVGFLAVAVGLLPAVRIFAAITGALCLAALAAAARARTPRVRPRPVPIETLPPGHPSRSRGSRESIRRGR
ncbi:MAG TPA: MFS transporter [Trebonia sp.]|nr:MFS transporter [Trebonia sp.]